MAGDIQLGFNFNSGFQKPLREYDVVNTIADRDAIPEGHRYNGRLVKVLDDGTGEGAWFELVLGTSSPDLSDNGNWVKVILSQHNDLSDRDAIDSHPISAITDLQDALDNKAEDTDLTNHLNDTNNPHQVSKDDVGLGFVVDSGSVDRFLAEDGNYRQVASGGLPDAPSDGNLYGRKDGAWEDAANYFVGDAPSDSKPYIRIDGVWEDGNSYFIGDAPADGKFYGRVDNAWVDGDSKYIGDAPSDSEAYIRVDNTWTKGSDYFIGDAVADGKYYSRVDNGWAIPGFKDLSDTPSDYTGNANKPVAVKSDETGLEFVDRVQAQSFGMSAVYTITQEGWIKVAKLITGGGRGKYEINIGAVSDIAAQVANIVIELSNGAMDNNIKSVESHMFTDEFSKVGIADLDSDGSPYLVVYSNSTTTRAVACAMKSLNQLGSFTLLMNEDADPNITPDQEIDLPVGNFMSGNIQISGATMSFIGRALGLNDYYKTIFGHTNANGDTVGRFYIEQVNSGQSGRFVLNLAQNGTEHEVLRITEAGNMGIGLYPSEKLEVAGNVKATLFKTNGTNTGGLEVYHSNTLQWDIKQFTTDNNFRIGRYDDSGNVLSYYALFIKRSNGYTGIGLGDPQEKLEVAGNVKADDFILSSDRRLKKNIEYDKLPSIDGLKPVKFTFKESGEQHYGFIAQDVRETHPELTKGTGEEREDGTIDYLSVKQMDMISMLVQEVQELKSRVTSLENELKELKSK